METLRGDSGIAGERIIVGVSKFHSWGKYTMPFTNINSDWMYFLWPVHYMRLLLWCVGGSKALHAVIYFTQQ